MAEDDSQREIRRSDVLRRYGFLGGGRKTVFDFDSIVQLAAQLCDTPMAAFSVNDVSRERFISCHGLKLDRIDLDRGFSDYVVGGGTPLLVNDTRADVRFAHAVLAGPLQAVRFYAGVPVTSPDGVHIGTLAVMDRLPRHLPREKIDALATLASQVITQLEFARGLSPASSLHAPDGETAHPPMEVDFHAIFDAIAGLCCVVEPEHFSIVAASEAFLECVQTTRDALIGKPITDAFRVDPGADGIGRVLASFELVRSSGREDALFAQRYPIPSADPEGDNIDERYWNARSIPVFAPDGSLAFIVHRMEDVTDIVRVNPREDRNQHALEAHTAKLEADIVRHAHELERLNKHLAMAQSVGNIGSWELRIADGKRAWSDEVYRILGVAREDYPEGEEAILAVVHPDDIALVRGERDRAIRGEGPLELTHRIVRPDGEVRYVHERARIQYADDGSDGDPEALYGTIQDITEQKLAEMELSARARRQHVVALLGQRALQGARVEDLLDEAVSMAMEMLDVDHVAILELLPDGNTLKLLAGTGWKREVAGGDIIAGSEPRSVMAHALQSPRPVIIDDFRHDRRFAASDLLARENVTSGMLVTIAGATRPFGILGAFATRRVSFTQDDANFLQSIANVTAEAIQRARAGSELRARATQQAAVSRLGREALKDLDLSRLQQLATELVAATFDVEYCMLLEKLPDGSGMKMVAGVGWKEGTVGRAILGCRKTSLAGYTTHSRAPVVIDDLIREMRFHPPPLLLDHGVVSGISVSIPGERGTWGMISAHAASRRHFTEEDMNFFQSIANVLAEVTQRANVDSAIRESEQRTRQAIDNALDAVISIDAADVVTGWNPQAEATFGWSADDAIGRMLHELIIPERYRDAHLRGLARYRATGTGVLIDRRVELSALDKDGREFPIELAISPLSTNSGLTFSAFVRDIGERKQREAALRESEERLRIIARTTIDTIWDWNLQTDEIWWNEGMFSAFGYDKEDLEPDSRSWSSRVHPDDLERISGSLRRLISGGDEEWREAFRFRRKDGSYAHVKGRGFVIRDENGKPLRMVGGMDDVTQQLEYEARLREQAELLDKAHEAIIVLDTDGRVKYWNKSAEHMYGWTEEEALGRFKAELLHEDKAYFAASLRTLFATGDWSGIVTQHRKDGSSLTVEATWSLVTDEDGAPEAVFSIITDITQRLALEEQLRQAQRLESIGKLTGGVAHDFNNLLTVILGNADLMIDQLPEDGRLHKLARMTRTAARRGAELTHRLLAFARRQALDPKTIDINQLVLGMEDLLRRTLLENVDIEVVPKDDLWHAFADPAQLESVMLNLAINAKDAMKEGGQLTIETANVWLDDEYAAANTDVAPGSYVLIAVSDTGHGIPPEILEHVFDPFFTTKEKGKGTGLGLSMAYGFAKQSGGHIKIYSEPGQGTTVKLYLPRAETAVESKEPEPAAEKVQPGHEKVLVVEDDDLVREHAKTQLARFGYEVLTAHNGAQALELIRSEPDIDLLFTDVIMSGGMNGRDLAEVAKRLRPKLKVLYTSGYTENAIIHHGRLDPGVHLLQKPYRSAELARKMRAVLDAREGRNE